jgi:murein DD-endopeptidase MepM/ murein hydrolase activator NlpD
MVLVLDHQATRPMHALRRLSQLIACLLVAGAGLQAARESTRMVPPPGHMLFAAPADPQPLGAGLADLRALALPGLATIEVIVQRDDTLDHIFRRLQLKLSDLADVRALDGVRELLDRLHPGEQLTFMHRDGDLVGLARQVSLTQELEVRRTDAGFQAQVRERPVQAQTAVARGVIDSSLFEAANAAGLTDATVLKLAHIFATNIDFMLGLRTGDAFEVEYERLNQYGHYVRDGDVLAARFVNQGHEYVAVRYVGPDGVARYFTPDGRSIEKEFLRAPLEFRRVSSGFSRARLHPILNTIRAHEGTDYAAPMGTPVYAAGDGRVRFRGQKGGYGNVIEIDHGGGFLTVYGHLSRFAAPKSGTPVTRGQTIGYVGMTGLATGPHLHYEFHVNGRFVDPQKVKLPDARPIDPALRADFERASAPLLQRLQASMPLQVAAGALP